MFSLFSLSYFELSKLSADHILGRSFGGKLRKPTDIEAPSLVEASGYNPKRQEFDTEYDNDAEQWLADMEFKDTDTEDERELKLRVLRIYSKRYLVDIISFCFVPGNLGLSKENL